jgi:anaphase-promoting complex subunit 1
MISDQELVQYHQQMVNTVAQRTLAVTVGQGIFEYGTRQASITDSWDIPFIELSAKIVPANTTLRAQISADHADWPCFHNGVSAALSISPESQGIDSSWIVFNRPREATAEHGGFLLGLGLTGHLRSLLPYHALSYLDLRNDFYSTGVLLGLACSHAGSEDLLITKALSLHTHALLPLGSMELNASPIIQSSALIGLGLVYAGSKNLRMAEVALSEVGRTTMAGVDNFGDYAESYSFSAAMAFGLTMLGRGGQVSSEVDRRLLAQLRRCILGDSPSLSETKSPTTIPVDPHLTAPGATLGLGLMYLNTNRSDIRNMLPMPQSALALEQVRPDLLLLRTFARALIMWDDISPTMGWIEDQLPAFILTTHKMHKHVGGADQASELAYLNILAGACFAVGLKYAGTATELAHNNLMTIYGILSKAAGGSSMTYEGRIRRTAARQALAVVALSLCVVMSGTGELNVLRRLRVSHGQEGNGVTYGTHMAMHMALGILFLGRGNYTLGNSNLAIAAMAIAFFPRFLSTPDDNKAYPQAFRHLWALAVEPRCLMARDVDSGEVVYLPVKIVWKEGATPAGVETQRDLNVGKTQSKSKTRTQSLISPTLIAPFDKLVSISVDSVRYWPITYDLSNPIHRAALVRTRTIHVKRKAGFLDYNSDPKGNRSIFVRAGSMTGFDMHYDLVSPAAPPALSPNEVLELVQAHSVDPIHTALARYFAGERERAAAATAVGVGHAREGKTSASASDSIDAFVRTILLECVTLDKPGLIGVYLGMLLSVMSGDLPIEGARQLKMVRSFFDVADRSYSPSGEGRGERKPPLVRPSFLSALERRVGGANAWAPSTTSAGGTEAEDELDPSSAVGAELDPRRAYVAEGRWTGDSMALARWIEREGLPVLPLLSELAGRVRQSGRQPGRRQDEVERRVLEVRVREAVERCAEAVGSEYDAATGTAQGGVAGGLGTRWKTESLSEAVGLWLGDDA